MALYAIYRYTGLTNHLQRKVNSPHLVRWPLRDSLAQAFKTKA